MGPVTTAEVRAGHGEAAALPQLPGRGRALHAQRQEGAAPADGRRLALRRQLHVGQIRVSHLGVRV